MELNSSGQKRSRRVNETSGISNDEDVLSSPKRSKRSCVTKALEEKQENIGEEPKKPKNRVKAVPVENAQNEFDLLTTDLYPQSEGTEDEQSKMELKLTNFQIYDANGYLVSLDFGKKKMPKGTRISGVALNFATEAKEINLEGGVPVADIEVTDHPFLCGFGEDDFLTIGVSTELFDLYFLIPHENYEPLFDEFKRKCELTKIMADFFISNITTPNLSYDQFTRYLAELHMSMENLSPHLIFILRHLTDYNGSRDPDEPSILENDCIEHMSRLYPNVGNIFKKAIGKRYRRRGTKKANVYTAVPLTPIVKTVFPEFEEGRVVALGGENEKKSGSTKKKNQKVAAASGAKKDDGPVKSAEVRLLSETSVEYRGQIYHVGDGVYLPNHAFKIKSISGQADAKSGNLEDEEYDKEMFPELFRKRQNRDADGAPPKPFCIGRITSFGKRKNQRDIGVTVRLFYRPHDTSLDTPIARTKDKNLLYFTDRTGNFEFNMALGRCLIFSKDEILEKMTLEEYYSTGRHRFYYEQEYNESTKKFKKISSSAEGKLAYDRIVTLLDETAYPKIKNPLRTMDLFSGVGGLSEGFHQSGVAVTKWACEIDRHAANGFKLNNPNATVYQEDCNILLKEAIENPDQSKLPKRGEVEMIIGGPPCQGFSGLNRFGTGEASMWKNSLVASFLCYVEYYFPRFVVMENVRTFRTGENEDSFYCRTLECLRKLGYTVISEILQAGHYGVPQNRNRVFIIAAKQDEFLPAFPLPTHSFLSAFVTLLKTDNGAPLRGVTVSDGISDLGKTMPLSEKDSEYTKPYELEPETHFQRLMRKNSEQLVDHVSRDLTGVNQERVNRIPLRPGADWRDLPNVAIPSRDMIKLGYDKKGKVCPCWKGEKVECVKPVKETLIPWCLPHTADKYRWAGLYGRLDNNGIFPTTVTCPEPMGKQGRVLHPTENRVISVREAARSQGFPDDFKFSGGIYDRYCQIGNAVPPPLAAAIGRQFLYSIAKKEAESIGKMEQKGK